MELTALEGAVIGLGIMIIIGYILRALLCPNESSRDDWWL